jgi:hypothetical protein
MMSSGTQVDLDWTGMDSASGAAAPPPALDTNLAEAVPGPYLTDEEILGIDPPSPKGGYGGQARGTPEINPPQPADLGNTIPNAVAGAGLAMPEWMVAAGDPKHGAEAQRLWQEHQAFRASFASPDEARAMKELFPGGAQEAQTLRQAAQAVDQLDAAIYSGDARAQSEVVAELARANPAAFRTLFAEAAKVLAGMGQVQPVNQTPTLHEPREGWGTQHSTTANQDPSMTGHPSPVTDHTSQITNHASRGTGDSTPVTDHPSHDPTELRASESRITNHGSQVTNHPSAPFAASQSPQFDPSAYAAFERSTNDTVARDVRVAVGDTLTRVLPEGIAEGAARRIGEDIFNEIHRTLAADRTLSEQVGEILRGSTREVTAGGWRFGTAEQQRVAALLAGRAKQIVPGVARRVIGEWTSSVLGASRSKAARQASAASRVDIAAPGGSLDSMPLRAMSSREVDYASMSDDEILGL